MSKTQKPPLKKTPKKIPTAKSNTKNITPNKKQSVKKKTVKINETNKLESVFGDDFLGLGVEFRERFEVELERQKLEAMAEFAAGAGHEINNPLAIISGHAQLLIREINNPEYQHKLATIITQVKRAYEMIADIRYFARPPLPVISEFDLVGEVNKIVEEQRLKLCETGQENYVEINFETVVESPFYIATDQIQLHIAIAAICNNARESLLLKNIDGQLERNHSGRIEVSLIKSGNEVKVSVEDNGIGISPEIRQLIFCPYFSGRQAGRGLGFGLPKAWRIIQQLKGSIKTETKKQEGTKFTITIPDKFES
jgi:signal transduction histidine kinase